MLIQIARKLFLNRIVPDQWMRPDELEHFLLFSSKKARTQQEDCQNRMNWKLVCQTGYDVLEALEVTHGCGIIASHSNLQESENHSNPDLAASELE